MLKETISPKEVVDFLNAALAIDPEAMIGLFTHETPCGQAFADHPTIQVGGDPGSYTVRLIGILNGLFGTHEEGQFKGFGPIAFFFDEKTGKKIEGFILTSQGLPSAKKLSPKEEMLKEAGEKEIAL